MNLDETITLIECLKESGATHFKSKDFEVFLGVPPVLVRKSPPAQKDKAVFKDGMLQPDLPGVENAEATERAKELISTLRNPEKLMDVIFPDGGS